VGSNGSVSYTVGQVVYTTNSGEEGSVAQGVQQTYEIYVITGTDLLPSATLSCKAFPNPVTDFLILGMEVIEIKSFSYLLSDINGKVIGTGKITNEQTKIQMGAYRSGNYFLQVLLGNDAFKTFKIVKK
jgi:hypothetical protein